mgnify:FL=1
MTTDDPPTDDGVQPTDDGVQPTDTSTADAETPDALPSPGSETSTTWLGAVGGWVLFALVLAAAPVLTQGSYRPGPETRLPATIADVVLAVVGLAIAYHALRAYARNDDRSILLFGGGLFLLTTVQAFLDLTVVTLQTTFGVVSLLLGGIGFSLPFGLVFAGVGELVDILGLVAVFYALLK